MASQDLLKKKLGPQIKVRFATSSSVPPRIYGPYLGLKFNLQKGTSLRLVIGETKTEKELPYHVESNSGINLARDIMKKSATTENKTEKAKVPPRKYGAHSGLKFNFKFEKPVVPKSSIFNSRADKEKGNVLTVTTVTKQIVQNEIHEVHTTSGAGKRISTVEEDVKLSREKQHVVHKDISLKNAQDDPKSSTESEIEGLCSTVARSLRVLQPQPQTSKSQSCNTLKPEGATTNTSKSPILNARRISGDQPAELEEALTPLPHHVETQSGLNLVRDMKKSATFENKTEKAKVPPRKYGAHSGLKFNFKLEKPVIPKSFIFNSQPDREKGNVLTVTTVSTKIFQNEMHKEVHTTSSAGKRISTVEEDVKLSREKQHVVHKDTSLKNAQDDPKSCAEKLISTVEEDEKLAGEKQSVVHKEISMKNVEDDPKSLTESEIEGLCSTVARSLRVLQPQPQTSKSQSCNTLKPEGVTTNTSKSPILNARQISGDRPAELEEALTPTRKKKYGFHAGLRFSFKEKKATPVDSKFKITRSLSKNECLKNDQRDPVF